MIRRLRAWWDAVRLAWTVRYLTRSQIQELAAFRERQLLYQATGLSQSDAAAAVMRERTMTPAERADAISREILGP